MDLGRRRLAAFKKSDPRPAQQLAALLAVGVVTCAVSVTAGCSAQSSATGETTRSGASPSATFPNDVTTINGQVPPERAAESISDTRLVESYTRDGSEVVVYRTVRAAGTRAPIHQHPFGATTCVQEGQMTLYLEGSQPQVANAGDCYWMPPDKNMTGVNSGKGTAVMFDMFTLPPDGGPVWVVVEKGQQDISGQFSRDHRH